MPYTRNTRIKVVHKKHTKEYDGLSEAMERIKENEDERIETRAKENDGINQQSVI